MTCTRTILLQMYKLTNTSLTLRASNASQTMEKRKRTNGEDDDESSCFGISPSSLAMPLFLVWVYCFVLTLNGGIYANDISSDGRAGRTKLIKRQRIEMKNMKYLLGSYRFRHSYRMTIDQFDNLVKLLTPYINVGMNRRKQGRPDDFMPCTGPNGLISIELRVSATLRILAGGDPNDIGPLHGISPNHIYDGCVWPVVNAI
jgi:hypothetical protein